MSTLFEYKKKVDFTNQQVATTLVLLVAINFFSLHLAMKIINACDWRYSMETYGKLIEKKYC